MNDFGFLPDDTLDIGQAWADSESAATAVLPETSPSKPFGGWTGEVPYAPDASYTSGHVRADGLQFDENGFVAGNTFMPEESLSFLDAVGSGTEYLKKKLKAKGWSGACCGSCAGSGGSCDVVSTPGTGDSHLVPLDHSLGAAFGGGGEAKECCCCVYDMCLRVEEATTSTKHTHGRVGRGIERPIVLDLEWEVIGIGFPAELSPCKLEYLEASRDPNDTRVSGGYDVPDSGLKEWDPRVWNDSSKKNIHGVRKLEDWIKAQKRWCTEGDEPFPGSKKNPPFTDPTGLFVERKDLGSDTAHDFFIFAKACGCGPHICGTDCCCALLMVQTIVRRRGSKLPDTLTVWLMGPVCGSAKDCSVPDLAVVRRELQFIMGNHIPKGKLGKRFGEIRLLKENERGTSKKQDTK